jgi:hypothetical protein
MVARLRSLPTSAQLIQSSVGQQSLAQSSFAQPTLAQANLEQPTLAQPSLVQVSDIQPSAAQLSTAESSTLQLSIDPPVIGDAPTPQAQAAVLTNNFDGELSPDDKLSIFDEALSEVERARASEISQQTQAEMIQSQAPQNQVVTQQDPQTTAAQVLPQSFDAPRLSESQDVSELQPMIQQQPVQELQSVPQVEAVFQPQSLAQSQELIQQQPLMQSQPMTQSQELIQQQPPIQPQPQSQESQELIQLQPLIQAQTAPSQSLNPVEAVAGGFAKERPASGGALDSQSPDVGTSPTVEYEPNPEIPPEVESFMQQVESHEDQLPQEIVVSGDSIQMNTAKYAAQPVVVLPYTKETEQKARFKGPKWSIRWLVEFGEKVYKLFGGKVIYREQESQSKE